MGGGLEEGGRAHPNVALPGKTIPEDKTNIYLFTDNAYVIMGGSEDEKLANKTILSVLLYSVIDS